MGTDGGRDSTFSSPAPSIRSMATTLTTVQSLAATTHNNNTHNPHTLSHTPSHYSGQPATAVPAHLAPHNGDAASVRSGLLGAGGGGGHGRNDSMSGSIGQSRDRDRDKDRERDRESGMVTAPTSPLTEEPGMASQYGTNTATTTTATLGEVSEKLMDEKKTIEER